MSPAPSLSVVVPLHNEAENVAPLCDAVREALDGWSWELVLVDDCSSDATVAVATEIAAYDARVRVIPLARNYGQTTALQAGFDHAGGDVIVTMDGDLQNDPRDIPALVGKLADGYDMVAGYRVRRTDRLLTRRLPSYVANRMIRRITGVPLRDLGCALKAFRQELLGRLHLYADMHRFLAVLATAQGARIAELPVRHHPRRAGQSKYDLRRTPRVMADLVTLKMIVSFRERPLALFGSGAIVATVLGSIVGVMALALRKDDVHPLVLPGVSLLCFGFACFLVMLGVIGEVVVRETYADDAHGPAGVARPLLPTIGAT